MNLKRPAFEELSSLDLLEGRNSFSEFDGLPKGRGFEPSPSEVAGRCTLGRQSWTSQSLCVDSHHGDIAYFTTRWDALCPYIDVNEDLLRMARRPLLVYALPPESDWGHPIRDAYGLAAVRRHGYWTGERRARKFKELRKLHSRFLHQIDLVSGASVDFDTLSGWGGQHFARFEIDDREIEGFVDYVKDLDILVLQVHTPDGEHVLTDVSMLLPERSQVYGSFCRWNPAYSKYSPGLYACLLAAQWTFDQGYEFYNLGPVGDFPYKSLFVNQFEPIYSLALCPLDHPLILDPTSPFFTDFECRDWNRLERDTKRVWTPSIVPWA
jgi:hypothetical protein